MQYTMKRLFKTYELFISGFFCLIFVVFDWLVVTKTTECEKGTGGLLEYLGPEEGEGGVLEHSWVSPLLKSGVSSLED
jgi:hypothetical protein